MTTNEKLNLAIKGILIAIKRLEEIQYQKASYKQILVLKDILNRVCHVEEVSIKARDKSIMDGEWPES